jgi:hypothetical protein
MTIGTSKSKVNRRRSQNFSPKNLLEVLVPRHPSTGSATEVQLRIVTFRNHRRVALAAVERQDLVFVNREAKVQRQRDPTGFRLHKNVSSCGTPDRKEGPRLDRDCAPRPVVDERIRRRPPSDSINI